MMSVNDQDREILTGIVLSASEGWHASRCRRRTCAAGCGAGVSSGSGAASLPDGRIQVSLFIIAPPRTKRGA